MSEAKSFDITKREVWDAYKRVKANRGAAGVDGVGIIEFDRDLSKNLYRIWNRMASGSYFPSPVKRVDIPKGDGKTRPLGIPTVADRIAQMEPGKFGIGVRRREVSLVPCWQTSSCITRSTNGWNDTTLRCRLSAMRMTSSVTATAKPRHSLYGLI